MSEIEIVDPEVIIPMEELELTSEVDERTPLEKLYDDMIAKYEAVKKIRKGGEGDLEKTWIIYIKANNKYFEYLDELRILQNKKEKELADSLTEEVDTVTPGAQVLPI